MYKLKIYAGVISYENEEWYKIWRGIDFLFQNWHEEFDKFWPEHSKFSQNFTLKGSFWARYTLYEKKRYRRFTFHDNEEWCKIWTEIDVLFQNWHEELDKFSPEHLEVSKLFTLMGSFLSTYILLDLKYRGVIFCDTE